MHVLFRTNHLRLCYDQSSAAIRAWGPVVGTAYRRRVRVLIDAEGFEDLFDMQSLRLHPLRGDLSGLYALRLDAQWRLIISRDGSTIVIEDVSNHYGD
jgi:plasmid maintenance system killer protein